MVKLAAIFTHPVQYFAPLLRALAARPDVDLTVYFCSRRGTVPTLDPGFLKKVVWDVPLLEGYRYKFLPRLFGVSRDDWTFGPINPAIVRELLHESYDAVLVHGYSIPTNWLAMVGCWITRTPIFFHGETHLQSSKAIHRKIVKEILLRILLRNIAAFLYIGSNSKKFYSHYEVPESRLFFTPYTVDNAFFVRYAEKLRPQRNRIRAEWGIHDDRPVVLFAGKLIPKKQPLLLLEAYRRLRHRFTCALLFAGDGPLRGTLEQRIAQQRIPDVRITGFLNQTELPCAYTAADVLVLPSAEEPWGLVVNEAMNFSLPIVVSDRVGCGMDLVRQGENGYVFLHHSADQLAHSLAELIVHPERREAFGRSSLEIIKGWDIAHTVEGILEALRRVKGINDRVELDELRVGGM